MTSRFLSILAFVAAFFVAAEAPAQVNSVAGSQIVVTPNAAALAAGQCVTTGAVTAPGLVRNQGPGGALLSGINYVDPAHNTAANDIQTFWIFNVQPVGTYTAGATCALNASDIPSLVGVASTIGSNCYTDGTNSTTCTLNPGLVIPPATTLYSLATSASSASGFTLTFSSVPAYIIPGMLVADTTTSTAIPNGTTVVSTTSTTVTLSQIVTSVGNGDTITFTRTAPTINNALWFIPIAGAAPTYGANKLTYTFMTQPFGN